jgi:hypothetical protein
MNSFIVTPSTYASTSTSAYTVLQLLNKGSVPTYKSSSSWRRFIHASTQQPGSVTSVMVIPAARTTTEGPTVLQATPLPEDYDAQIEDFWRFVNSLGSEAEAIDDIMSDQ